MKKSYMIVQKVWNWVKVNYFCGSLQLTYKADTFKSWEEIVQYFKNDLQNPEPKYKDELIAFSSNKITIKREKTSVFRWSSDVLYLTADVSSEQHSLLVDINVTLGEHSDVIITFWRGAIFAITVIAITAVILTIGKDFQQIAPVPLACILLILNLTCWLYTFYFRYSADSLYKTVKKTIDEK